MYRMRTLTAVAALILGVSTQGAWAQLDSIPVRPGSFANGDFEDGMSGWTWDYQTSAPGLFESQGRVQTVFTSLAPEANSALQLSSSLRVPAPPKETTGGAGLGARGSARSFEPVSGPIGGQAPLGDGDVIGATVTASQQFTYDGGRRMVATASMLFGARLQDTEGGALSAKMRVDNLTTGASCSTVLASYDYAWPCTNVVAFTGETGAQAYALDLGACEAQPGDVLEVTFTLQVTAENGAGATVEIYVAVTIDDVAIETLTGDPAPSPSPSSRPGSTISILVEEIDDASGPVFTLPEDGDSGFWIDLGNDVFFPCEGGNGELRNPIEPSAEPTDDPQFEQ
ncbi:MAG: hypothetical protein ACE5E1_04540 [Phycisphaerae bacterium]